MIKICGITNLDDALAATGSGATAIGFNFYSRSKRYITPEAARLIAAALPHGMVKVGVFVNEAPAAIERIVDQVPLDVAQLHGEETAGEFPRGVRVWKALRVEDGFDPTLLARYEGVEAFLLDGPAGGEYGGAGVPFAWSLAARLSQRVIVAGGLDAQNVARAITEASPWGVDACSRLESAPGRKDHEKMIAFVKAALAEKEWK